MKKFTAIMSIIPSPAFVPDTTDLPRGVDFYNDEVRRLEMDEKFLVVEGDKLVQVRFAGPNREDWTDQLPDDLAAMLGRPNLDPEEDEEFHARLRFQTYVPLRILEGLKDGDEFTVVETDKVSLTVEVKQASFRTIKTFRDMLRYVTK